MSKQFMAILAAIVILFVGAVIVSGHKSNTSSNGKASGTPTEHVTGNPNSNVTLTEYGDYECPYCEQYSTTVQQVVQINKDKIRFQFRNFPLIGIHQNAFAAARAAEAAGLQNKFWEMHDALYQSNNWQAWSQSGSPNQYFDQYAQQIGLNATQFKSDFNSDKVNNLINADMAAGNKLGINGTPTFFLDGKQVQIANDPQAFQKVIDAELAKKQPKTDTSAQSGSATPAPAAAQ